MQDGLAGGVEPSLTLTLLTLGMRQTSGDGSAASRDNHGHRVPH